MWDTHTLEYDSAIKKRMKSCICDYMDGPTGYYAK